MRSSYQVMLYERRTGITTTLAGMHSRARGAGA